MTCIPGPAADPDTGTAGARSAAVRVRPLDRATAPAVIATVFVGMSPQSRYLRFHSPMPRPPSKAVTRQLVDLDGHDRAAVVAEVAGPHGWRAIGVARLADVGGGRAELAMAVVDAWHGRGVGRRLLSAIVELATRLGYTELYGDVLPENAAMLRLLRQALPTARSVRADGVVRVQGTIGPTASPGADPQRAVSHEELIASLLSYGH